jgi:hypothetical protein
MSDLEFTCDGMFYSILPNTRAGEDIMRQILELNEGSHKVFVPHFPAFKAAVKAAGVTIRKARSRKSDMGDDELLAALAA